MCVYVCGYVRICVYMCVFVCICVFMWCLCVFMCVHVCLRVHSYMYLYIHWRVWWAYFHPILTAALTSWISHTNFSKGANYGNLCQYNEIMYYNIRLLGSSNCGHRSWPVNVNVRNPIKRDTMAPTHCLEKNLTFHPEMCRFLYGLETEWTMTSS